jgi:hypothetical protein
MAPIKKKQYLAFYNINTSNTELNPICHWLALFGAHHILHISRIRVNILLIKETEHFIGFNCNTLIVMHGTGYVKCQNV